MTQPYPFAHTADTWHAKASAARAASFKRACVDQSDYLPACRRSGHRLHRLRRPYWICSGSPPAADKAGRLARHRRVIASSALNSDLTRPKGPTCPLAIKLVLLRQCREDVLRHQLEPPAIPFREFPVASAVDANDKVEVRNHNYDLATIAARAIRAENPVSDVQAIDMPA